MITVVGAGMGGLTLARILHLQGAEVQVFDRDASPTGRPQGGMLDIHVDSGQAALRAAGLLEKFRTLTLAGGDAVRVLDKTGTVLVDQAGNGRRPEVDRGALRDLLLSSLPDGMVRWGHLVTNVRPVEGGYELTFANGHALKTEVLIGADGAWSKVRSVLSEVKPVYSGLSFVETHFFDADTRHPGPSSVIGQGLFFALGDGKGIMAHRKPNSELCIYAALKVPADWAKTALAREALLEHFADWDNGLRALIADSDSELVPRQIHALPVGHRWERASGMTLVGDAAHLMSPFAGEGVNLAMIDGADLALAIIRYPGNSEAALAEYEAVMFPRAENAARDSAAGLGLILGPDAAQGLAAFFNSHL